MKQITQALSKAYTLAKSLIPAVRKAALALIAALTFHVLTFGAHAAADPDVDAVVDTMTDTWTPIKGLAVTLIVFSIGFRLLRKYLK